MRSAFGPVLRALRGQETTLTALAAELDVSKQAAARVLDYMRRDGLVAPAIGPADGRCASSR